MESQQIQAWAASRLNPPVRIDLRFAGRGTNGFLIFAAAIVAFFLLGPPIYLIVEKLAKGVPPEGVGYLLRSLGCLGIWIIVGLALMAVVFIMPRYVARRHIVKEMDTLGVTTRGGARFQWTNLKYLHYQNVNLSGRGVGGMTQRAIFTGVEPVSIDMIFEHGKAIIPPLVKDQDAVLALIETMPVERREG